MKRGEDGSSSHPINHIMHAAIELAAFWAVAFLTLCLALVLLNIFGKVIQSDVELLSLGQEAIMAAVASLIEAMGVWLIVVFISSAYRALALRAMIVPIIIVALIYRIMHLESWSVFEAALLLAFQIVIGCVLSLCVSGHYQAAIVVLFAFVTILTVIGTGE